MKEVVARPANTQEFMIFLFFPFACKYNHLTIPATANQGKIKGMAYSWPRCLFG